MARKPKMDKITAENEEVTQDTQAVEVSAEEQARQAKIADLAAEEVAIKNRLAEIQTERRELGVTRASNRGPRGVGDFIKSLIKEGKTNDEILAAVREQWPLNNTNANCVNWYRNALKQWPEGKRPGKKAEATANIVAEGSTSEDEVTQSPE